MPENRGQVAWANFHPRYPLSMRGDPSSEARNMPKDTLTITDNRTGKTYEVPVTDGTIRAMDLRQIKVAEDDFGMMTHDPGFLNTSSCRSSITYIDGDQGILRYRGGITGSRGHEGANPGRDAVIALVRSGQADRDRMPVFGCPLFNPPMGRPEGF